MTQTVCLLSQLFSFLLFFGELECSLAHFHWGLGREPFVLPLSVYDPLFNYFFFLTFLFPFPTPPVASPGSVLCFPPKKIIQPVFCYTAFLVSGECHNTKKNALKGFSDSLRVFLFGSFRFSEMALARLRLRRNKTFLISLLTHSLCGL